MQRRPELELKVIRGVVLVAVGLALAIVAVSLLPAYDLYKVTTHGCDFALTTEHHSGHCTTTRELVGTERGFRAEMVVFLALLLAPGALMWWRPRVWLAVVWSPVSLVTSIVYAIATFKLEFDFDVDRVSRWPSDLTDGLLVVLYAGILAGLPIAGIVYAVLARRRPPPPGLPRARVVS